MEIKYPIGTRVSMKPGHMYSSQSFHDAIDYDGTIIAYSDRHRDFDYIIRWDYMSEGSGHYKNEHIIVLHNRNLIIHLKKD